MNHPPANNAGSTRPALNPLQQSSNHQPLTNAGRLLCVYENRSLKTDSMYAVPRIASQLLEKIASKNPAIEVIAASPDGGQITGVRSISARASRWSQWQSRIVHSRATKSLPMPRSPWTKVSYHRAASSLKRFVNLTDDDTIVLCMTADTSILARQILPRARLVYWVHSLPRVGHEARAVAAINAADAIVVPSQAIYRDLFALVCRNSFQPPVWVIPNFIDEHQFAPITPAERSATRRRYKLGEDDLAIVHVGRAPEKGLKVARTALALCAHRANNVVLVSVGGTANGRHRIADGKDMLEIGRVTPSELNQIYQACDLGVVPSVWWENCPLALLEMMSLGMCIVASRVGGIPEMIEHEKTGLLVDSPNDVCHWATVLDSVFESPERRQTLGRAAQESLGERFSASQFIGNWESVLGTVGPQQRH